MGVLCLGDTLRWGSFFFGRDVALGKKILLSCNHGFLLPTRWGNEEVAMAKEILLPVGSRASWGGVQWSRFG